MSFLKLWNQFFQEPVAILVIPRFNWTEFTFNKAGRIFVAWSFFVLDTEGDLWRDCYSSLVLKRLTILLTVCARSVSFIVRVFLECLSANKSFLAFLIYGCSMLDFKSIVKPSSFHSVTLSSSVLLQQSCNFSSLNLCLADSWFDVISINFALPVLNTGLLYCMKISRSF